MFAQTRIQNTRRLAQAQSWKESPRVSYLSYGVTMSAAFLCCTKSGWTSWVDGMLQFRNELELITSGASISSCINMWKAMPPRDVRARHILDMAMGIGTVLQQGRCGGSLSFQHALELTGAATALFKTSLLLKLLPYNEARGFPHDEITKAASRPKAGVREAHMARA